MSLYEDLKNVLDSGVSARDLLYGDGDFNDVEFTMVEDKYVDSGRWSEHWRSVYQRKTIVSRDPIEFLDEYVAVEYSVPATEMQEVDSPYDDIYVVTRREVKKFEYVREQ